MPGKLEIKQVRSIAGASAHQRRVIRALGFTHREQVVVHSDSPSIKGMVTKVKHLLEVKER